MSAIHEITEEWQREGLSPTWVKLQQAKAEHDALTAIVEQVQADRAELVKKLAKKAELLRGCYAADHKQKQRINVPARTLTHIHGVAMAEDHRDLPGIAKDAKEALEKKHRTVTYICPVCAASL